jgi:SAM-dependent methyltransferase
MSEKYCRFCRTPLTYNFVDLGMTPLANSYLTKQDISQGHDLRYPLNAWLCSSCLLVQVEAPVAPEAIFTDYAYFSSYSDSWVEHSRQFARQMIRRFQLSSNSLVVEVASNDGYLLQHFVDAGLPVLGVEPAANVAEEAKRKGVPTEVAFFDSLTARRLASEGIKADLTVANNVLAHVPHIDKFIEGFSIILKPEGVATFEFPHLLNLIDQLQFDTIYHEHYSYLSLLAVENVLAGAGLRAFDVEELPTHGGSLRLYVCHKSASYLETNMLNTLRAKERERGLDRPEGYEGFASKVAELRLAFIDFLKKAKKEGKVVAAYGAAAKGNTFLNVCGVTAEDIVCVFDRSGAKQGRYLPGSHIPILDPEDINTKRPDYLVILPWNLKNEIMTQMASLRSWGGKFVTAIPAIRVYD